MSKIFALTRLGKRAYRESSVEGDELRVLEYLKENHSASDDQLEIVGGEGWVLRGLKKHGLIKELTT